MTNFQLTDGEKSHPLWGRIKAHLKAELDHARVRNDDANLSPIDTAAQRGRIACLKSLIQLGDDRPIIEEYREAV